MCDEEKPYTEFSFKNKATGRLQSHCKPCHKEYRKSHYQANKHKYIDKARERRQRFKQKIREIKSVPCFDCKIQYPFYVMQFDHRNPKEKEYLVSRLANGNSIEKTYKEIQKCDIVCANCHAERTYQRLQASLLLTV